MVWNILVPSELEDVLEPGVYAGRGGLTIDGWAVAYLETGMHLREWEERCKESERMVAVQIADLVTIAARREAQAREAAQP